MYIYNMYYIIHILYYTYIILYILYYIIYMYVWYVPNKSSFSSMIFPAIKLHLHGFPSLRHMVWSRFFSVVTSINRPFVQDFNSHLWCVDGDRNSPPCQIPEAFREGAFIVQAWSERASESEILKPKPLISSAVHMA